MTFDPTVLQPFGDEKLTAYELGIKTRLFSNFQISAAVFDYEYRNAQIYGQLFDFPLVVLYGIANVGNARVMGVEADVRWRSNDIVCICPDYRDFSAIANQVDVAISHPVLIKSGRSVRWPS